MWIRRIFRRGDSNAITLPVSVARQREWAGVQHVEIQYDPPRLIITPLRLEDLMQRPRTEGEELVDDEAAEP